MEATAVKERARLIVRDWVKGEPMVYQCSLCNQVFTLCDAGTAKESATDLRSAFKDHVREYHPENVAGVEADDER
jgi:hypothetical protein